MQGLDQLEDDTGGTVFRDVIMLALAGFVAIVLLLLPHLNPPPKAEDVKAPPGSVIVEISWPDEIDVDVDLWVLAPGGVPVGYSNKGGRFFNLLRDDLGHLGDVTDINYEVSYSRGIPPGEYVVNLHLFRNGDSTDSVAVIVVASVKTAPTTNVKPIVTTKVDLRRTGEEITAFRFTLGEKGELVPESVHSLPIKLRSEKG